MPEDFVDPDAMSFEDMELDFSQEFNDETQFTAPEYPKEGQYHVSVASVDSNPNWIGSTFLKLEIITGNVPKQEGKMINHAIFAPGDNEKNPATAKKNWMKTVGQIMLAFGLRKEGEFPKVHITPDFWQKFEGKQCIVRVTHKTQTKTTESGSTYEATNAVVKARSDFLPLFHSDVASVPYDKEAAKMQGYKKNEGQKEEEI